jgi:hypothetical protein
MVEVSDLKPEMVVLVELLPALMAEGLVLEEPVELGL